MSSTVVAAVVSIAGLCLLLAGLITVRQTRTFADGAATATGTVTDIVCDDYMSPEGDAYYHCVVTFTDSAGQLVRVTWPSGMRPPPFTVGQQVPLLYNRDDPQRALAKSFGSLWYSCIALLGIGAAFTGAGLARLLGGE